MGVVEQNVPGFYDSIAGSYDEMLAPSLRAERIRNYLREQILSEKKSDQLLLEIGCGTGTDAVFLASQNIKLLALDISPGMIAVAEDKAKSKELQQMVSFQVSDANNLNFPEGTLFDGVFSVFNALNHLNDLEKFARDLSPYLKPGAKAHFVMLNTFCPVESSFWMFRFKFKTAFKKFFRRQSTFTVFIKLYSKSKAKGVFSEYFKDIQIIPFGILAPPDPFKVKWLERLDKSICKLGFLSGFCDHYIISMTKK